jgi:Rab9 effector protein with kelch motifs
MALPDGQHRNLTKDGSRRAQSVHGSPAPIRDVALPGGDERSLTPPVPSGTSIPSARSESLPTPYPSGSNSSLSASTTTLRASNSSRTQRAQSASSRRSAAGSPTSGTVGRRLPTPNANASSTSLSAAVAKSPRVPVPDPTPRFRAIPHLPNVVNVDPAPPPVMYWSKAPIWGTLPTHGFRAHTVTLADNVAWIFGGCDEKGCFKDMWCFNIGACARHPSPLPVLSDRMG